MSCYYIQDFAETSEESRAKNVIDINDEEIEIIGERPAYTGLFVTPIPEQSYNNSLIYAIHPTLIV